MTKRQQPHYAAIKALLVADQRGEDVSFQSVCQALEDLKKIPLLGMSNVQIGQHTKYHNKLRKLCDKIAHKIHAAGNLS